MLSINGIDPIASCFVPLSQCKRLQYMLLAKVTNFMRENKSQLSLIFDLAYETGSHENDSLIRRKGIRRRRFQRVES